MSKSSRCKVINTTIATFGRLDYTFNNAGIEGGQLLQVDFRRRNWDKRLGVNLPERGFSSA
jgi:NAD(P)-dependent dehydrogenase (short-subunit alcohol dehydrogenase family)